MTRIRILVSFLALMCLSTSGAWAQSLGSACTGSGMTSPVADGGLLKCNGSTYVGTTIYSTQFTAGTPTDGVGHVWTAAGAISSTGAIVFTTPSGKGNGYIYGDATSNNLFIDASGSSEGMYFYTNNVFAMAINPSGNVGIGTTSPGGKLDISGTPNGAIGLRLGSAGIAYFEIDNTSGAANQKFMRIANTGTSMVVESVNDAYSSSTNMLQLFITGNMTLPGTLTQNSDLRLKTNIQELSPDVFEKLALIKGVTFNWKDKGRDQAQQIGVIAQDVQKAYPQLVTTDPSGTLSVNYSGLVAPLIEAVKQLHQQNDALQREVTADHDLLMKLQQQLPREPSQ